MSAAWKIDASSSLSTVENLLAPFPQSPKRPLGWIFLLAIVTLCKAIDKRGKMKSMLFLINNLLSSMWSFALCHQRCHWKLWKTCRQQKWLIHFCFLKEQMHRWDSVICHFFSWTTQDMSLWVCFKNSCWSQKVVDEKESSTRKNCQQHLVLCFNSLKFVSIVTVEVCVCSSPLSK